MRKFVILLSCYLIHAVVEDNQLLCEPFAARLSLGYYYTGKSNNSDMIDITFNTNSSCPLAYINIWRDNDKSSQIHLVELSEVLNMTEIYDNFTTAYNYTYITHIHTIQLQQLVEGEKYHYEIYGNSSLRPLGPFEFKAPFRDTPNEQRVIFFGDMDSVWFAPNTSGPTFDWFQRQVATNKSAYDLLVFTGDMAYNLEAENCVRGDYWMRNISIFTPYWPLMVMPGNHDAGNNTYYSMVRKLFRSPQRVELNTNESYYNAFSWNLGLVHFLSFNPYWVVYNKSTQEQSDVIFNSLQQDLVIANRSREQQPWIIVTTHYPMYCSDPSNQMCGNNWVQLKRFAELFTLFNVDMYIAAHQHDYERDKPLINNVTAEYESEDSGHIIKNAKGPIYIVEGAAGNNYYMPPLQYPTQPFTQEQSTNLSVGVLTIKNRTHLYWEQVDSLSSQTIDYLYLVKIDTFESPEVYGWRFYFASGLMVIVVIGVITGGLIWFKHKRQKHYSLNSYDTEDNNGINRI